MSLSAAETYAVSLKIVDEFSSPCAQFQEELAQSEKSVRLFASGASGELVNWTRTVKAETTNSSRAINAAALSVGESMSAAGEDLEEAATQSAAAFTDLAEESRNAARSVSEAGEESARAWNDAVTMMKDSGGKSFLSGLSRGWEEYAAQVKSVAELSAQFFKSACREMADAFSSMFYDAFTGRLKSAEDYFKSFAEGIARYFSNLLGQLATQELVVSGGEALGLGVISGAGSGVGAAAGAGAAGGLGLSGVLGTEVALAGGGSAAALSAPLWAVGAGALAAGGGIYAAGKWLYEGSDVIPDWAKNGRSYGEFLRGAAGETEGAHELGDWQELLKSMGLSEASAESGWGFESDTASADTLITSLEYLSPIYEEIIGFTREWREELGFTNATAEEMASTLMGAFSSANMGLQESLSSLKELRLGTLMSDMASGQADYEDYLKVAGLTQEEAWLNFYEKRRESIVEQLSSGAVLSEEDFKRLQTEYQLVQQQENNIVNRVNTELNISMNISPTVENMDAETRTILGKLIGEAVQNNEGGLADVMKQAIDDQLLRYGVAT